MLWCRDAQSNWKTELEQSQPAEVVEGIRLNLTEMLPAGLVVRQANAYDPWKDQWSVVKVSGNDSQLPAFKRSLVLRMGVVN
jgi:hypothetical protein